ncbi:MAG: aminotransferase class IV [Deltaproteobacteria bacterium]|jgi:4-amino-4-deoxychorismate lyase|nr:aminotransferase class IV [Deltaproteobacteria bacterium]
MSFRSKPLEFVETIKWDGSSYRNLPFHAARLGRTFQKYFGQSPGFDLEKALPTNLGAGVWKVRLIYAREKFSVEAAPYVYPVIKSAELVATDLYYGEKFTDRAELAALKAQSLADEVILVKDGWLTDATFTNLVFQDKGDGRLYTPDPPLLAGVKRAFLLSLGYLIQRPIAPADLSQFARVGFINALIDLEDEIWLPISAIWPLKAKETSAHVLKG